MTPTEFFTSPLGIGIVMAGIGFAVALLCYLEIEHHPWLEDDRTRLGFGAGCLAMIVGLVLVFGWMSHEKSAFPYEEVQRSQVFALREVDIVKNVTTTTDVDLAHYGVSTTGTITQYETAYTGGAIILHDEAGTRYTISEVRQSATVTEPEFRLTWTEETLPDNVEPDARHPRVRDAYYHQVVLVLPMPDPDKVVSESQGVE